MPPQGNRDTTTRVSRRDAAVRSLEEAFLIGVPEPERQDGTVFCDNADRAHKCGQVDGGVVRSSVASMAVSTLR